MVKGLLSIIIPVYNGEKYLHETIQSLISVSYSSLEVILVNDGSTDSSEAICRQYADKDARIRTVTQSNSGIAAARNTGMRLAEGEYVAFCDQDDLVSEDGYCNLIVKMTGCDAQIGMFGTSRLENGQITPLEKVSDAEYSGSQVQIGLLMPLLFRGYRYPFMQTNHYIYGTVWKCVFRSDFLKEHEMEFVRFVNYEDDWLFLTKALTYAVRAVTCSYTGYYWRVIGTSESHKGRYIPDICDRYERLDEYVSSYIDANTIENSISSGKYRGHNILEEFHKVMLCDHYVELFRNSANVKKKERREYRKYVKEYMQRTDYREQLSCMEYSDRLAHRKKLVLTSLQYFGRSVTYMVSNGFDVLEYALTKVHWIVSLERRSKMK